MARSNTKFSGFEHKKNWTIGSGFVVVVQSLFKTLSVCVAQELPRRKSQRVNVENEKNAIHRSKSARGSGFCVEAVGKREGGKASEKGDDEEKR